MPILSVPSPSRPRVIATTLGVVLVTLLVASGGAPPAHAASYPTWSDVQAARGNEQRKKAEIQTLNNVIASLTQASRDATAEAAAKGTAYQKAQDALDQATGVSENLSAQVAAAQTESRKLSQVAGLMAAALAKPGGSTTSAAAFLDAKNPDELLSKLSMSSRIGLEATNSYTRATISAKTTSSLAAQAAVAKTARTALANKAESALRDAVTASRAALTAQQEKQANLAVVQAQLATLNNDRVTIEQGYAQGVTARAAAARAAAEARARALAAAAAAARAAAAATPHPPTTAGPVSSNGWTRPITSYSAYQAYGYRIHPVYHDYRLHAGADFSAACGTPIYATSAGTVTYAGPYGGYGNLIIVDHGGGITSAYAHVFSSGIYVRVGQTVSEGQNIAGVGNAGVSTGCHLHFEIRVGGVARDPMAFLATKGVG